ncbi:MAG: VOC family protein [Parvularculaceae bacterium]
MLKSTIIAAAALALVACGQPAAPPTETPVASKNNKIDYVEFAAEDLAAFKKFYGEAFGWTFQDWGPDYISFEGAGLDGGVRGGETPVVGGTMVILYADDLEASENAVVKAGGVVTARHEFPGGKRFHFRDPTGNELAVWTKAGE